jgi:hypothetical protein
MMIITTQPTAAAGTTQQLGRPGVFFFTTRSMGMYTGVDFLRISRIGAFLGVGRGGIVCDDVCMAFKSVLQCGRVRIRMGKSFSSDVCCGSRPFLWHPVLLDFVVQPPPYAQRRQGGKEGWCYGFMCPLTPSFVMTVCLQCPQVLAEHRPGSPHRQGDPPGPTDGSSATLLIRNAAASAPSPSCSAIVRNLDLPYLSRRRQATTIRAGPEKRSDQEQTPESAKTMVP